MTCSLCSSQVVWGSQGMGFAEGPQLPAHPQPCSKGALCCDSLFSMDSCISDFPSLFCHPFSRDAERESTGLPAAAVDTLPPCTAKRLSCTGWVLPLCHHSEAAPLGTAWQLFSPLGKETLSSCPLLTFGDAHLEKQALGGLACSEFVQECESES